MRPSLPVGTILQNRYRVLSILGQGGFGRTYLAEDQGRFNERCALKELTPAQGGDYALDKSKELFQREAQILYQIQHPQIPQFRATFEQDQRLFLVQDYVEGQTYRELLDQRKAQGLAFSEGEALQFMRQLLPVMAHIHSKGVIHRDIAPDNIMVLPDGRSVLMDFGAARRIIGGMSQAVTTVLKPGYAPIEQYAHDGAMHQGAWTDVYVVGSVLYQAMTGQTPVQAIARMGTDPLLAVGILSRQTSRATYSDQLCVCVMKSMAVQPASRFQTIQALRAALGWDPSQGPLHPVPPSFDPSATAVFGRTVNDKPIASAGSASAANKAFDPLATVVPARPATKTLVDPGAADTRSVQPMPKFGNAENVLAEKALSPTNARTALWAGLTAAGLAMAAGLIYLMGSPADPAASPPATVSSPPVPIAVEPVTAAPALAATVPGPTTPGPLLAAEPVAPIQAAASTPPMPAIPATSSEAAVLANPANPTANVAVDLPTTGVLRVEVKDGWAAVFVNGEDSGVAPPLMSLKLPPGSYDIELRNPALPTVKRSVKVVAGKTATLRHAFIKDTPPTAPAAPATPAYPAPSSAKPVTTY